MRRTSLLVVAALLAALCGRRAAAGTQETDVSLATTRRGSSPEWRLAQETGRAGVPGATREDRGPRALVSAIRAARPQDADALIRSGVAVNFVDEDGMTPLALVVERGNVTLTRALLRAGAKPDARLPSGETALHRAAIYDRTAVIEALLEAGADVNARVESHEARRRWTPLMAAAAAGNFAAAELLIERGADVDARNAHERTALFLAAWYGHEDVVERLLRAGADRKTVDVVGLTPRQAARLAGHDLEARYLALPRGAD